MSAHRFRCRVRGSLWMGCLGVLFLAQAATSLACAESGHAGHGDHSDHADHSQTADPATAQEATHELARLPDVELIDQHGDTVRLPDLVAGRRAAINFVFTSCTTVCPPMGALFAHMQRQLEAEGVDDVAFVSISIDPAVDTPARLKEWADRFDGSDSWRLLTGPKLVVDDVLKELGVFTALEEEHAPLVLLGDAASTTWIRAHGLAPPADLIAVLDGFASQAPDDTTERVAEGVAEREEARDYFTDTVLVDQHGRAQRFYSDLVADRTVVINPFFATCAGSCPVMHRALHQAQDVLADRLGRDVFFLSISVDPEADTPERLRAYAEAFGAGPGWSFLTGDRADVDRVLARLGQQVSQKEAHQAIFLVGNERTGLWQKVFGLGPPEDLLAAVQAVADDEPSDLSLSTDSGTDSSTDSSIDSTQTRSLSP